MHLNPPTRRHPAGYTLLELMVSTAVVAVLAGIAVPAYGNYLEASRATEARLSLLDTYIVGSRKAAVRGQHVVACPGDPFGGCRDSIDWSGGWIVFADLDEDRLHDPIEPVLMEKPALGGRVHLRSTLGRKRIVFQANGGNAGSNVTFTLCDGRGPRKAVHLVMANDGRLRARPAEVEAATACMAPWRPMAND